MSASFKFISLILGLLISISVEGQIYFTNVNSVWDNRMDEWTITGFDEEDEEVEYLLSLTWPLRNNWEDWRISSNNVTANIRPKWKGDFSQWEFRTSNEIIVIRQLFRGDMSQWEIREGNKRVSIRTYYRNNANDWIRNRKEEDWHMFTEFLDDPRDWEIEDYSHEELSESFRLAMIFIALWQSIPKS